MDSETHTAQKCIFPSITDNPELPASYGVFSGSQNFTVSGGNFTNITKSYHAAPTVRSTVPPDFRMIPFGDIDLQREVNLECHSGVVDRRHVYGVRRVYSANIEGRRSLSATVAIYEGDGAEEEWRRDVEKYMAVRHPNIVQVFGTAKLGNIYATILHDELIPLEDFLAQYRDSHFSTVYIYAYVAAEFEAAAEYIDSTFQRWLYDSGCILFIRRSTRRFCADLVPTNNSRVIKYSIPPNEMASQRGLEFLGTPNMNITVIETLTLKQYHEICYWNLVKFNNTSTCTTTVNLGAVISCSSGNQLRDLVEVASLPHIELNRSTLRWQAYGWEGNVMDDGWTRFDLGDGADTIIWLELRSLNGMHWLSQANHLFKRLRISANFEDYVVLNYVSFEVNIFGKTADSPNGFLFLAPPRKFQPRPLSFEWPDCAAYWSLDPSGAERLSTEAAANLGFPSITLYMDINGRSFDASVYAGLRRFHLGKGFDPDSQDVARHLGQGLYQLSSKINVPFSHFVDEHAHDTRDGEDLQSATAAEESQNIIGTANTEHVDATTDAFLDPDSGNSNLAEKLPVSSAFKFVLNVQLSMFLFLALSWLYGQI